MRVGSFNLLKMSDRKPVCFCLMINMWIIYLLFCAFVPTLSRKEYPDLDTIPKNDRKLLFELVKRLQKNDDDVFGFADSASRYQPAATQQCGITTNSSAIIKRKNSEDNGAKFIKLEKDIVSNEACSKLCCGNTMCDMAVYEDKGDRYCYLFSCQDLCEFGYHANYMSNWIRRTEKASAITPEGSEQEEDLAGLGEGQEETREEEGPANEVESSSTSTSVQPTMPKTTTTISTATIGSFNIRAHSVGVNGTCAADFHCEDPNSVCRDHRCRCQESFYEKNHICREVCVPSSFECLELGTHGRGPQCVGAAQVCDGVTNCADGSDEFNCPPEAGTLPKLPVQSPEGPSQSKLLQQSFEHHPPVHQKQLQPVPLPQQQSLAHTHAQSAGFDDGRSKNIDRNPGTTEQHSSNKLGPSLATDLDLSGKLEHSQHSQLDISQQRTGFDNPSLNQGQTQLYTDYDQQPASSEQKPFLQTYADTNLSHLVDHENLPQTAESGSQTQRGFSSSHLEQPQGREHPTAAKLQTNQVLSSQVVHPSDLQKSGLDFPGQPQQSYSFVQHEAGQMPSEQEQLVDEDLQLKQMSGTSSLQTYMRQSGSSNLQQSMKTPGQGKGQPLANAESPVRGSDASGRADNRMKPQLHPSAFNRDSPRPIASVPSSSQHHLLQQPQQEQNQHPQLVQKQHPQAEHKTFSLVQQHPQGQEVQQAVAPKDVAVLPSPSQSRAGSSHSGSPAATKVKQHSGDKSLGHSADSIPDLDSQKAYIVAGHNPQAAPAKLHHPLQAVGVPEKPESQSAYDLHGGETHSALDLDGQKDYLQGSDLDRQGAPQFLDPDPYLQQSMYGQQYPSHRYQAPYLQQPSGHGSRYLSYPDQTYPGAQTYPGIGAQNQRLYQQQGYLGLQDLGYPSPQYEFGEFEPSYSESDTFPSGPDIPAYRQDYKLGYDTQYKTEPVSVHGAPARPSKQGAVSSTRGQEQKDESSDNKNTPKLLSDLPVTEPKNTAAHRPDMADHAGDSVARTLSPTVQSSRMPGRLLTPATTISTDDKAVDAKSQNNGGSSSKETKVSPGVKPEVAPGKADHAGMSFFVTKEEISFSGITADKQGPIIALSLGLVFTLILLIFVACRLRTVRHRLRKGRPLHSNEADYLINGMYL